ncbi:MAG: hypothetical protein WAT19_11235 [Ferruginibacter sp.]
MNQHSRFLLPFVLLFSFFTLIILLSWNKLAQWEVDGMALLGANIFFLLVSVLVFFILRRSMGSSNPNVFIRAVISGMMIKMFLTVIAVLVYALASGGRFSKYAVFASLFIYLFYLAAEVAAVLKLNKKHG